MTMPGKKPEWLTFDCYGTLVQWDEGLVAAVEKILSRHPGRRIDARAFVEAYDRYEHQLEHTPPHKSFRTVAGEGLRMAMGEFGLVLVGADIETLTSSIDKMPPFPEVVDALGALKSMGFKLCIISNTDDDIIAGNVAQMGGHIDRVITAQQARAYKPSRTIFAYAYGALRLTKDDVCHVCASPRFDLAAARDIGFRCIWIDRGTGRKPLPDYTPDAVLPTLDRVPAFFRSIGWV
jgi:2-haloacid dehalogenase